MVASDKAGGWWRALLVVLLLCSAVLLGLAGASLVGHPAAGRGEPLPRPATLPSVTPRHAAAVTTAAPTATGIAERRPTEAPRPTPTFVPTQPPTQPTPIVQVEVIYDGAEGLHLRDGPNQQIIAALLAGSWLTIRGEARDEAGFRWWPVEGAQGWMAEGPRDPAEPRWLAPVEGGHAGVGGQVRVLYPGADGLNLRRAPGPASEKVATLLKGASLTVVDRPQTVDGVTWWAVRLAPGWVAEGPADPARPRWIRFVAR